MSLGVLTTVFFEGVEQLRIKTCQASEVLKAVYLVGFALV
jgi:hypothetical protein